MDASERIEIRPARDDDGPALREIERVAGERFRDVGLPQVADDEPPSLEVLSNYAADGRSWLAVDPTDGSDDPVGYLLADVVDDAAHIEQVSVRPDHQGRGVGRALVDHVRSWAAAGGLRAVTLSTFTDVAWNAPLYRHLGFRFLRDDEIGPQLRARCEHEAARGLDPEARSLMRLDL